MFGFSEKVHPFVNFEPAGASGLFPSRNLFI